MFAGRHQEGKKEGEGRQKQKIKASSKEAVEEGMVVAAAALAEEGAQWSDLHLTGLQTRGKHVEKN